MVMISDTELAEIRKQFPAAQIVSAKHHHYAVMQPDVARLLSELRRLPLYAVYNIGSPQRKRQGVYLHPQDNKRRWPV